MIDELVKTIRVNKKKNIKTSYTSFLINSGLGNCVSKMQEEFDELVEAINKDKFLFDFKTSENAFSIII